MAFSYVISVIQNLLLVCCSWLWQACGFEMSLMEGKWSIISIIGWWAAWEDPQVEFVRRNACWEEDTIKLCQRPFNAELQEWFKSLTPGCDLWMRASHIKRVFNVCLFFKIEGEITMSGEEGSRALMLLLSPVTMHRFTRGPGCIKIPTILWNRVSSWHDQCMSTLVTPWFINNESCQIFKNSVFRC